MTITEQQYGFMSGKSTTDAVCFEQIVMESIRLRRSEGVALWLHRPGAYDMRTSGGAETYVQDMYQGRVTVVRATDVFKVEGRLKGRL